MKLRILLVDDDLNLLEGLRRTLHMRDCSWELAFAENGHQALELLACSPFDVVVTDLFMPVKDGLETIRELRCLYPELKIIVISGGGWLKNSLFLDIAKKLGAHYTLCKPFRPQDLIEAISGVLQNNPLPSHPGE